MIQFIRFGGILVLLSLSSISFADGLDRDRKLTIALDLSDGSHVIGIPSFSSVPVRMSYGRMNISLEQILSITFHDDRETATIEMINGDRLTGVVELQKRIKLITIFGKISVDLEHVRLLAIEAQKNFLLIEALIDGKTELHVSAEGIYWVSKGFAKPGRHLGRNEPTWVNGMKWMPKWGNPEQERGRDSTDLFPISLGSLDLYDFELLAVGSQKGAEGIEKRDPIRIERIDRKVIIIIPDRQPDSKWYRFRLNKK